MSRGAPQYCPVHPLPIVCYNTGSVHTLKVTLFFSRQILMLKAGKLLRLPTAVGSRFLRSL